MSTVYCMCGFFFLCVCIYLYISIEYININVRMGIYKMIYLCMYFSIWKYVILYRHYCNMYISQKH